MFICSSCHKTSLKWAGKCPHCGEWNTLEEMKEENKRSSRTLANGKVQDLQKIGSLETISVAKIPSTSGELDGVL
jgi:DNA repair protein RadA/Sms